MNAYVDLPAAARRARIGALTGGTFSIRPTLARLVGEPGLFAGHPTSPTTLQTASGLHRHLAAVPGLQAGTTTRSS